MSTIIPAPAGMLVLDASEILLDRLEIEPPSHAVLGFQLHSKFLYPVPVTVCGVLQYGFCLIRSDGTLEDQDGVKHETIRDWIDIAVAEGQHLPKTACNP